MSHRNFGIPTLFEVDPYSERRAKWRRDFWQFVAIIVVAIAAMFSGFAWLS